MHSFRERTFQALVKNKTISEVLDICEADQIKMDSCFPNVQSIRDFIIERLPGAVGVFKYRRDIISVEDHIELARALVEGKSTIYGIMIDLYGETVDEANIGTFFKLKESQDDDDDNNLIYPCKLGVDGPSPKSGTGCVLLGYMFDKGSIVDNEWYPFPVRANGFKSIKSDILEDIVAEFGVELVRSIGSTDPTNIRIKFSEKDERNEAYDDLDPSVEILDLILKSLKIGMANRYFPVIHAINDVGQEAEWHIFHEFRFFE